MGNHLPTDVFYHHPLLRQLYKNYKFRGKRIFVTYLAYFQYLCCALIGGLKISLNLIDKEDELYQLKAWYLYHKILTYYAQT